MYHIVSVVWSLHAGHQKGMIISCRRTCHSQRGKATQSIGKEVTIFLSPFQIFQFLFSINPLHILTSVPEAERSPEPLLPFPPSLPLSRENCFLRSEEVPILLPEVLFLLLFLFCYK